MYLVSSYIMVVHRQQLMPFWLSLPAVGEGFFVIYREGVEIKYFLLYFIGSANKSRVGYTCPSKPCRWRGKWLVVVGMFVCLYLAS
jgi:hypothetical protein